MPSPDTWKVEGCAQARGPGLWGGRSPPSWALIPMHPCSTCATSGRAGATWVSVCSPRDGVSNQSSQAGFKSSRRCSVSASRLVVTSSTDGVDGFSTFLPVAHERDAESWAQGGHVCVLTLDQAP